jgi:hypothetical protein
VLYIVTCAAPPALDVGILIDLAQQDGWDVCLIATPRAFQWIDVPALSQQTGHPVRHDYKLPSEPDVLPEPDAIIVAPATFNTLNKWAAGDRRHPGARAAVRSDREGPGCGGPAVPERGSSRAPGAGGKHRPASPVRCPGVVRPGCPAAASSPPGTARPVPLAPHPSGYQGGRCTGDPGTAGPSSVASVGLFLTTSRPALRAAGGRPPARRRRDWHRHPT